MKYRILIYVTVLVVMYFITFKWLHGYQYVDYKDCLALLSSISGMVFVIMGIWIAFLYPNAMSRIINSEKLIAKDFSESKSDAKRLEGIVGAIISSIIVMIGGLFFTLLKIVIQALPFYLDYRIQFKSFALSFLFVLVLMQLESVMNVVISNVMFINDLHFKRQARQSDEES
ncbi:hypothetical protein [Janthinobacterium sp. UMAB-56]|uniref:hypothetical protein n=1 Tax=Janthinobacterium sp. UMAB-56 TaxID=1365361 RepID=UPI001C587B03|nr:hypothetical protein [Janthinobacterium sp. UMAB-56]